jgi:hypothetical protein
MSKQALCHRKVRGKPVTGGGFSLAKRQAGVFLGATE